MKKAIFVKAAAVLTSAVTVTTFCPLSVFAAMDTSEFPSGYTYPTEMRGLSAFQIANDMGAGWNLGNSLESSNNETDWGNPKTTKAMIDAVAAKGFTTLRVPVRWDDHYSNPSNYTIDSSYMDRVDTVVNYGLANDMYVILNVHHNDLQEKVPNTTAISNELSAIWTQVGERFKNYGDKLIFEVNNEPRCGNDWGGSDSYYESVNQSNEAARAAIRATGGNNASRLVMLPTYCASGDAPKAAAWTKNSSDNMIAASIHAYLPFDFAFNGEGHTNWISSDETELQSFFSRMETYFIDKGVPVVIGEFGNTNKGNTSARVQCADTYVSLARQFAEQDIPCVVWDNNCYNVGAENFGLFNRNSCTFTYGDIAAAIVNAYNGDPDYSTGGSAETIISNEVLTSNNWGQALKFDGGIVAGMQPGESIFVNYSSTNTPELILQDTTSGSPKGWVKVNPDSASNGVAVWSYETLLNAFGGSFGGLTFAYIGDTGASLTVTKVYILSPNAHTHNFNGAETVTLAATPTTQGRKTIACSVSGCQSYRVALVDYTGNGDTGNTGGDTGDTGDTGGETDYDTSKVSGFVDRLYTIFLNRNAESAGLADWTNRLISGTATSAEIVYGIAASPEFGSKGLTNDEIVERMYLAMLDRPSDAAGKQYWVNGLNSGMTVNGIINGFSGSQEFANICAEYGIKAGIVTNVEARDKNCGLTAFTARMYTKALGRSYDVAGLNDWTNRYITGKAKIWDIAYGFIFSQEFLDKKLSDSDYVDTLYRTFFDREADADGKADWVNQLKNGVSRETVLNGFVESAECKNLVNSFGIA